MRADKGSVQDLTFENVKHEVVVIEFKTVLDRKTTNSLAFLNMPVYSADVNVKILQEVMLSRSHSAQFSPFNKSIIT